MRAPIRPFFQHRQQDAKKFLPKLIFIFHIFFIFNDDYYKKQKQILKLPKI